jgi:serine/threonine-protein kinase TTK/MPS1
VSREEMSIAMVLEAGDVDLAKVLSRGHYGFTNKDKGGSSSSSSGGSGGSGGKLGSSGSSISNPFFLRTVWGEMLEAVHYIHENRIVHGDLKPANFVFVRGQLKLIDFGIAKAMSNDTTNIYRDSQVGTINYMAPEAISPMADCGGMDSSFGDCDEKRKLKMRLGRPSDIWSLGCILYQMLYGRLTYACYAPRTFVLLYFCTFDLISDLIVTIH